MSGTRKVDWIYVDDVIDGYLAMACQEGIDGRTFDIGSGALVAVSEVVEQLSNIIDPVIRPSFGSVTDRPMERIRVADVEKTYETLGWRPKTTLKEGLTQTVDWYQKNVL